MAIVFLVLLSMFYNQPESSDIPDQKTYSIAVLPFDVISDDPKLHYFADAGKYILSQYKLLSGNKEGSMQLLSELKKQWLLNWLIEKDPIWSL